MTRRWLYMTNFWRSNPQRNSRCSRGLMFSSERTGLDDAIDAFRATVKQFPDSANALNALGLYAGRSHAQIP